MANRHKFKKGGKVELDYGNKNVAKEAKEHAKGGPVEKKAKGGKVETKASGGAAKPRFDKKARGGGTDMKSSPFSGAHIKCNGDAGK